MKIAPILPPPGTPDEIMWLVAAINRNFQDIEQLTRRGLRAPLGQPGLPSIGFQNPGFDGVGASGMQDNVTGVVQGIFWEANAVRHRAASPATGAIAEVVPRDVPDAGATPARISAYETDVQGDPENFSRMDVQAGTDMKLESYKRGSATLRDLVLGVDDGTFTEAERIKKTETVINEPGSATMDFRVEGDTDPNMIFVDASVDRVGIGEGVPTSTLDIDGSMALPTSAISSSPTADGTQHTLLVDATAANRTITLPAASGVSGRIYVIKKIDSSANTVTIDPNAAELIDGAATKVLSAQWDSLTIQSDGTSWFIIADKIAASGGSTHDILSATHTDTTAAAVARGALMTGQGASPTWTKLVIGAAGTILKSDGTDVAWGTPAVQQSTLLDGGTVHTDTASAAVARGAIVYGDTTPRWNRLGVGAAGFILIADGTDIAYNRNYGTTVYLPTCGDTAINSVTDVTIATRDVGTTAANDVLIIEGEFIILNNSTATRVYNITVDFDTAFVIEMITGSLATSSTLLHPCSFRFVCNIRSTSLAYCVGKAHMGPAAGIADSGNPTLAATDLTGIGWASSGGNLTGTTTCNLKIRSASATATQTCRLVNFEVRRITPGNPSGS